MPVRSGEFWISFDRLKKLSTGRDTVGVLDFTTLSLLMVHKFLSIVEFAEEGKPSVC